MSRAAQALLCMPPAGSRASWPKIAALLAVVAVLPACAGGFSLKQAEVDRSLYTSAIPGDAGQPADASRISDEVTIRNAVSSADLESLGAGPLAWANSETGARGSITGLTEYKNGSLLCRRFTTTRESFDGVLLFRGETCMAESGDWRTHSFSPI